MSSDQNKTNSQSARSYPSAEEPEFLRHRINRYYWERVKNTWDGGHILRGLEPTAKDICLMSNDYLALSSHPDILNAQSAALYNGNKAMLMSAVFLNANSPQQLFEQRLANFMNAECGILCQSGWCANTGLIQSIADEQTPVYLDMLAHMSLWEGARSAGSTAIGFHHNDLEHLERQILRHGPGVICVDSVYSINGSICPLVDVAEIAKNHNCVLVVDESHSLGTHGHQGEGLVASLGLSEKVHFTTASLAKAFSGRAGFITCSKPFHDYFMCESRPYIFSSSLLPYEIAGLEKSMQIIQQDQWRRSALHSKAKYVRNHLEELGYNLQNGQSQIIALEAGTEQQTIILRNALESRGIFGAVFFSPATPKKRSLIRFSINCALNTDELEKIIQVCGEIRDEVGLANWASTRRKHNAKSTEARKESEETVCA